MFNALAFNQDVFNSALLSALIGLIRTSAISLNTNNVEAFLSSSDNEIILG